MFGEILRSSGRLWQRLLSKCSLTLCYPISFTRAHWDRMLPNDAPLPRFPSSHTLSLSLSLSHSHTHTFSPHFPRLITVCNCHFLFHLMLHFNTCLATFLSAFLFPISLYVTLNFTVKPPPFLHFVHLFLLLSLSSIFSIFSPLHPSLSLSPDLSV